MNVVFVVPRFHPYRGGYENYILKIASGLHSCGHKVTILTSNAFDLEAFWLKGFRTIPPGDEDFEGLAIRRFAIDYRKWIRRSGRLLALVGTWKMKARFGAPGFHVKGLADAIRRAEPDIVHIGPLPYTRLMYEGLREAKRCDARVIATPCTHFGEDASDQVSRYYTQPAQMHVLKQCDALLTLTKVEEQRLVALGVKSNKIRTTRLGVDFSEVTGGNEERFRARWNLRGPIVLQLGTKAADKGTVGVLEGMKHLWAQQMDVWLVLAGASTSEFDRYLHSQPAMPRLLNLGPVSETDKRDLLAAATLLLHPSRVESFGIVYLEAWANGKPVIGADTAVSREVIERSKDGLLVRFGDPKAISEAVRYILRNPLEAARMGQCGYTKVRAAFSWDTVLPRILDVFSGACRLAIGGATE
jgi:glycosyltransferase involved in cell wall biosynthesis